MGGTWPLASRASPAASPARRCARPPAASQLQHARAAVKWAADYLRGCHLERGRCYVGLIGNPGALRCAWRGCAGGAAGAGAPRPPAPPQPGWAGGRSDSLTARLPAGRR